MRFLIHVSAVYTAIAAVGAQTEEQEDMMQRLFANDGSVSSDAATAGTTESVTERAHVCDFPDVTSSLANGSSPRQMVADPLPGLKPFSGLIVDSYPMSREYLQSLGPELGPRVRQRLQMDGMYTASLPMLEYDSEVIPERDGGIMQLRIFMFIARSSDSTVATVVGRPDLVIRYQSNCYELSEVHPLMREFWMMSAIADLGFSPKPLFLSPPTKLMELATAKTDFRMPSAFRRACAAEPQSTVRYMVLERTGVTVESIMDHYAVTTGLPPLQEAVTIMVQAIGGIGVIHKRGIVHGDIDAGALSVTKRAGIPTIDFLNLRRSFYLSENRAGVTRKHRRKPRCWSTHWAMEGNNVGMRDDVLRILMVGAYMMNGRDWLDYCVALQDNPEAMMEWKREAFLFVVPGREGFGSSIAHLSADSQASITQHLMRALTLARSARNAKDAPPHEAIKAELLSVLEHLERDRSSP